MRNKGVLDRKPGGNSTLKHVHRTLLQRRYFTSRFNRSGVSGAVNNDFLGICGDFTLNQGFEGVISSRFKQFSEGQINGTVNRKGIELHLLTDIQKGNIFTR